jgi:peptidoglycan/xylan/chitin deacetylase (PgdA/CDA1 family)
MKRALLPAFLAATLLATACSPAGSKPTDTAAIPPTSVQTPGTAAPVPDQPAAPDSPKPQPPAVTPPVTGAADAPAPAAPPPAGAPSGSHDPVQQAEPKPVIKWHPRGIGLPVVSDDPAAQGKKVVVLTFDDGPSDSGSTARILDILAENNVKAMFFITGYGAKHRDLVEREVREGHVVAPHSMTHDDLAKMTLPQLHEDIDPLVKLVEEVTGSKPKYLRPPFGSYNDRVINFAKEQGMEILNWTDGSLDWDGVKNGYKDPNQVVKDVMQQLYPGAVVLMHDTLKHTSEALPEIIRQIRAEGYEFIVLD